MRGRMNIPTHGGGGGGSELYVYAQKNEPEGKDGIWIKTKATGYLPEIDKFTPSGVTICESNTYTLLGNIPYNANGCQLVAIDNNVYMFSGYNGSSGNLACKYDIQNNTYTLLGNIPYNSYGCKLEVIDNNVYMFSGYNSSSVYRACKTYFREDDNIYIATNDYFNRIKILDNFNIPLPHFAGIAQNNNFLNYPAYYGDGNSWRLLKG